MWYVVGWKKNTDFPTNFFFQTIQHLSSNRPSVFLCLKQLLLGNSSGLHLNIDINIKAISINHWLSFRYTFYSSGVLLIFIVRDREGHGFIAFVIYEWFCKVLLWEMCDNSYFVISDVLVYQTKQALNVEIIHAARCEISNCVKPMVINLSVPQILPFQVPNYVLSAAVLVSLRTIT